MIANLGYFTLVLTLILALYGAAAAYYGATQRKPTWIESGRHAMALTFPLTTIASLAIIYLLVSGNYHIKYVASVASEAMPTYLKVTALWGGQEGSLVFWAWLLAGFTSAVSIRKWDRDREFLPWVIVVGLVTLAFFISLVVFFENPFEGLWLAPNNQLITAMFQPAGTSAYFPPDGNGLNPLLRHPGMVVHPPLLYLGFVSFVIPFAFAIAALITGRSDDRWIRLTRRWTLVAWLFLSLGLILGGRWAYDVLGWGGYWGWDPVEIAAFMPWLTGTAFLHSVIIQEKRGMLKHWNMILIILTYSLVIFGTFLTRSGVLSSVHSFAASAIGPMFFGFIALTFAVSLALLIKRWGSLRSENQLDSMLSREALFLLNNLLFMGVLVVCFWGVLFPLISEIFTGQKVTVGPPFYERAVSPLWLALILLMGVAPLSAFGRVVWKRLGRSLWMPAVLSLVIPVTLLVGGMRHPAALIGYWFVAFVTIVTLYEFWRGALARRKRHGENVFLALWRLGARNRRRYGGYVIHLGVVIMAIGILGIEIFQSETQGTLARGEQISLGGYTMIYDSLTRFNTPDGREVTRAEISIAKDGRDLGQLYPRKDYYIVARQPMTIPGVYSTLEEDFYVLLVGWEPSGLGGATFKVYHNPQVNFVWSGGLIFIIGTMIAAWPDRDPAPARVTARRRRSSVARA